MRFKYMTYGSREASMISSWQLFRLPSYVDETGAACRTSGVGATVGAGVTTVATVGAGVAIAGNVGTPVTTPVAVGAGVV